MTFPLYELQSSNHVVISPGEIQMLNDVKDHRYRTVENYSEDLCVCMGGCVLIIMTQ